MSEKHNIVVQAQAYFIKEQSSPEQNRYVFAYSIIIRNDGTVAAKLLRRQWLITDSNGKVQEVHGEGVVGKQPHLQPGELFRYTSGAILETAVGIMEGYYFFTEDDGSEFTVVIPKFTLSIPRTLH